MQLLDLTRRHSRSRHRTQALQSSSPIPGSRTLSMSLRRVLRLYPQRSVRTPSSPIGTVCNQRHVLCKKNFGVTYNPFALDDWVTFAHDFQRTGLQTQSTGITAATVSQLRQRWKVTIPDTLQGCNYCCIYGSPVVYDGNVIVPSYNGTLYDFSATDGSIRWKTKLATGGSFTNGLQGSFLRAAPLIDTVDGLVLIGIGNIPCNHRPCMRFTSPTGVQPGRRRSAELFVPRQYTPMALYMRDGQAETNPIASMAA